MQFSLFPTSSVPSGECCKREAHLEGEETCLLLLTLMTTLYGIRAEGKEGRKTGLSFRILVILVSYPIKSL